MNYNNEELEEVLEEFYDSCIRNGYYDMTSNANYFCKENNHMEIEFNVVLSILKKIDKRY